MSTDSEPVSAKSNRVRLTLLCASFMLASPTPATAEGEWVTVTDKSLEIEAGSPLDFSTLVPPLPDVRMVADGERLRFGAVRLPVNCATLAPGFSETPKSAFPDHEQAARYAEQLRRHGYNIVRFHYLDALLMGGAKQDFAFDPEQVDRFQYFTAELRKRGIHWIVDILSSDNAALGGIFPHRWSSNNHMVARTFLEASAFRHWQELARRLLTTPNPYTGYTLAKDPHTALLILANEPALVFRHGLQTGFARSAISPMFLKAYQDWAVSHGAPQLDGSSSPDNADFQRFLSERQVSTLRAMVATVRDLGYTGLYTSFDNWPSFNQLPSRQELPLIDMHAYEHDQIASATPGQKVTSSSSFDDAAAYLQEVASARIYGKPMILTEHDQIFWNPNRFESGLFAPTFAALQGWEFICRHADGPIDLQYDGQGVRKNAVYPDGGGLDPVARAGETLTALLQLRAEIRPLETEIRLEVEPGQLFTPLGEPRLSGLTRQLSWLARIGIERGAGAGGTPGLAVTVRPSAVASSLGMEQAGAQVAPLVDAQVVSRPTATSFAKGIIQPGSGQVTLRSAQQQLLVQTSQTAAYAGKAVARSVALGPVQILSSNLPGLIAVSALDSAPLATSRRLLVILASNARNTGMQVDRGGTLRALGTLPVQLQRMRATLAFRVSNGTDWRLTPLSLTGIRRQPRLLGSHNGMLNISLDTAQSEEGPTTYFVLERAGGA